MKKPRYKHFNCAGCKFWRCVKWKEDWFDVYRCGRYLVFRWGDQPEGSGHFSDDYIAVKRK